MTVRSFVPSLLVLLAACGGGIDATEAANTAAGLVGGTAEGEAEAVTEDGHDLWETHVSMDNGAELQVYLFAEDGALFEVKDEDGPFDYDALDPLPGQLTYAEARDVAMGEVAGTQIAWEVKWDGGPYFYEFYIEEAGEQLWEIKLWADDGEVFVVEGKDEVD